MKLSSGTLFFVIISLLSLGIAVYFFISKGDLLFSSIFFIGFILCLFFSYQEYVYTKNKDIPVNEKEVPAETNIKYSLSESITNILLYIILIVFGIFLCSLIGFKYEQYDRSDYLSIAVGLFLIIGSITKVIKIIRKISLPSVLAISNQGITLNSTQKMMWNDIKDEKIITRMEYSDSKYKSEVKYLTLYHKSKKVELKLEVLNIADYTLEQYLKIYRNRFNQHHKISTSDNSEEKPASAFENIMNIDALFALPEKEFETEIKNIGDIAEKNTRELTGYCEHVLDFENTNLRTIYFALSENSDVWGDFLSGEFIRLFEKAKTTNDKEIYSVLDEITCEYDRRYSPRVANYLYNELNSSKDTAKSKALWYISSWMDGTNLQKSDPIVQKIVKMLKDDHWKIRWMAHDILTSLGIFKEEEIAISSMDKLKGKTGNPYEID
ncbi:hypothetical protein HNP38_000455 [Chryseobacterium defluvii]|uniref:Uncharacterized protein n=1 Tax=Chryseobacterium defluvii TaxID=160396 RepID=A0A840KCC4_9FLAO|nr:hypothetical protein [Chryseobacterium defluvii]MBB4805183.1 hypothetical protein [Chryseobacterium defluvii]